jgi:hypothetical protein
MSWVLRASLAEKTEGSARASSKEFVCNDWVPPKMAAMASTQVRTMLLYGSCSVSDQPVNNKYESRLTTHLKVYHTYSAFHEFGSLLASRLFLVNSDHFRSERHFYRLLGQWQKLARA